MSVQNLVHEVEVQRQHARYKLPLKVTIAGRTVQAHDWSVSGFGLANHGLPEDVISVVKPGNVFPVRLHFEFDGFEFALAVKAEVRYWNAEPDQGAMGLKFIELSARDLSLLHYIINAHLAGEIVGVSDVMDVVRRDLSVNPRKVPDAPLPVSLSARLAYYGRRGTSYGLVAVLSVTLVWLIGASIYKRTFLTEAQTAHYSAEVTTVSAPATGRLKFVSSGSDEQGALVLKQGEPLLGIETNGQNPLMLDSPCDCKVVATPASDGDFVRTGDDLLVAAYSDAVPYVLARVDQRTAIQLGRGQDVQVAITDGVQTYAGTVREVRRSEAAWSAQADDDMLVEVVVDAKQPPSLASLGQTVRVVFDTSASSGIGRFANNLFGL